MTRRSFIVDESGQPMERAATPGRPVYPGTGYFGAQSDELKRQELATFARDTRVQMSWGARTTLLLISRTLAENYGPARALQNLARFVGYLRPQCQSGDTTFDELAEKRFHEIAGNKYIFDASGRHTFYSFQQEANYRRYVDGDIFAIMTSDRFGRARVAAREAHLVESGMAIPQNGWYDGVRINSDGRPIQYRFINPDVAYPTLRPKVIGAGAVHHMATFAALGATRGTPAFSHALNDFRDLIETKSFVKQAIRLAAQIGLTKKKDDTINGQPGEIFGIGAPIQTGPYTPPGESVPDPVPEDYPSVKFEDYISGGLISQVPLETLQDERPHPNQEDFKKSLLREAAVGIGVPPQLLYFMDSPGGAEMRTLIDLFSRFVMSEYENHLEPLCQRFWSYCIAREIIEGRLPMPSTGTFWAVRWVRPRSLTADFARVNKTEIDLRKANMTTFQDWYDVAGSNWEDKIEQLGIEAQRLMDTEKKYSLPPGTLLNAMRQQGIGDDTPKDDEGGDAKGGKQQNKEDNEEP